MTIRSPGQTALLKTCFALFSHWRRHLGQFFSLIGGLSAATALFVGVQSLNSEARESYARAEQGLGDQTKYLMKGTEGRRITPKQYGHLRRAGLSVTPMIEGKITLAGKAVTLIGYDPLTLGPMANNLPFLSAFDDNTNGRNFQRQMQSGKSFVLIAQKSLENLGLDAQSPGDTSRIWPQSMTPPYPDFIAHGSMPQGYLYTDIAYADRLLKRQGLVDKLVLTEATANAPQIPEDLIGSVRLVTPSDQLDLAEMTQSFHLNLTAFSFLSFLVGLFIVYAALSLSYQDRLPLFRTLFTLGISRRTLTRALMLELVLLAFISGLLGLLIGYGLASLLMPGVSKTINALYGASVDSGVTLSPAWVALALSASLAGACLAGVQLISRLNKIPILAMKDGRAWHDRMGRAGAQLGGVSLLIFFACVLLHYGTGSLVTAFLLMASFLVSSAMVLPLIVTHVFAAVARLGDRLSWQPKTHWFWAEAAADAPRISLALMALLLALSTHFGVKTMVSGYRETFTQFLDERLAADIYLRAESPEQGDQIIADLTQAGHIDRFLAIWSSVRSYQDKALMITSFDADPLYRDTWTLAALQPGGWAQAEAGLGIMISEQMAIGEGLEIGQSLRLITDKGPVEFEISGIFSDYGNPIYQVRLATDRLTDLYYLDQRTNYGLIAASSTMDLITLLKADYGLDDTEVIDQKALKDIALTIFNQTFKISAALGVLTLIIASGALLSSLISLADQRTVLLAPLWGMGVPRRYLAIMELCRILALALFTAIIAMPIGMGVAYILIDHINVAAFGWRLPYHLDPAAFYELVLLALLTGLIAVIMPMVRLVKTQPAKLAKVFAHEG